MYLFKKLTATYNFTTTTVFTDGRKSEFAKQEDLTINREKRDKYLVTLLQSSGESLNGAELDDFDKIMLRIGKTVYPAEIMITGKGEALEVVNFGEIKSRSIEEAYKLKHEYEGVFWIEQYINLASAKLNSGRTLLESLRRSGVCQFLFWNTESENNELTLCNFPEAGINIPAAFGKGKNSCGAWHYNTAIAEYSEIGILGGNAKVTCRYSELGDLLTASAKFTVEHKGKGYYRKIISMSVNPETYSIRTGFFG